MRKQTEQELKGGNLPQVLKMAIEKYPDRISENRRGDLAVDKEQNL